MLDILKVHNRKIQTRPPNQPFPRREVRNETKTIDMHSSSVLVLNLAVIPAAYFYGTGGLSVQGVRQWLFHYNNNDKQGEGWRSGGSNEEETKASLAPGGLNVTTTTSQALGDGSRNKSSSSNGGSGGGDESYVCLHNPPDMRPMFLSYEPIMVYLENFLTEYEREYLVQLA